MSTVMSIAQKPGRTLATLLAISGIACAAVSYGAGHDGIAAAAAELGTLNSSEPAPPTEEPTEETQFEKYDPIFVSH